MKLQNLTKEREGLIITTQQQYINRFNNTKRINQKQFEKGIKGFYKDLLKKKTPKIVYCESWLEVIETIDVYQNHIGKPIIFNDNDIIEDIRNEVKNNIISNKIDIAILAKARPIWRNVNSINVYPTIVNDYNKMLYHSKQDSPFKSFIYFEDRLGWVSYYEYFEKINLLKNDRFKKYKYIVESCIFGAHLFENFVFAIQPPTKILRNEQGQMNSIEEKAFEWSDGYGFYYINGLNVSEELFNKLKSNTYTTTDFAEEQNEEVKSAVISFIQQKEGEEGIYRFFAKDLKEVDTFVDKKEKEYLEGTTNGMNIGVYTLFKGQINNTDVAYVRCYCPSTDRMFFLGVEPTNTNAKDAIASLYQVPKVLKNNIVTISRQGEIFSTTLDEKTTEKLKNNEFSLGELEDYVSLDGDTYFAKMTYEY